MTKPKQTFWRLEPDGMGNLVKLKASNVVDCLDTFRSSNDFCAHDQRVIPPFSRKEKLFAQKLFREMFLFDDSWSDIPPLPKSQFCLRELEILEAQISALVIFAEKVLCYEEHGLGYPSSFRAYDARSYKHPYTYGPSFERYGLHFDVRLLNKATLLRCERADVIAQGSFKNAELLRFDGLSTDKIAGRTHVHFRHRLALYKEYKIPLSLFLSNKFISEVYQITHCRPLEWVHLAKPLPLLPVEAC